MLRDKSLIPLSRQHQHALALCVRIDRASPVGVSDLEACQAEVAQVFQSEIKVHFVAEEQVLFPAANRFSELSGLVGELIEEHARLRDDFAGAEARKMPPQQLAAFAQRLSAHIRKEERQLFEHMQELMSAAELAEVGVRLEDALKDTAQACALPKEATKLGGAK